MSGVDSWTEWGVRFGDGDIDYDYLTRELAEQTIAEHRQSIASGEWDAADYEPMSAVSRQCTRVETHTDWTAAQPGEGDAARFGRGGGELEAANITWAGAGEHAGHMVQFRERWRYQIEGATVVFTEPKLTIRGGVLSCGRVQCSCGEGWTVGGWPTEVVEQIEAVPAQASIEEEAPDA